MNHGSPLFPTIYLYVYIFPVPRIVDTASIFEKIMIYFYFSVLEKRYKTFCIVINNVLSIVINIQNTTIFVILTGFYTSGIVIVLELDCLQWRMIAIPNIVYLIKC